MWKKIVAFSILIFLSSSLFAMESLLSLSTNRLFLNQNDWILRPNSHFDFIKNDVLIAQGDYGRNSMTGINGGGALLGYYHSSKAMPFSLALSMNFQGEHLEAYENSINTSKDYYVSIRSVFGIPSFASSSIGLSLDYIGVGENSDDTLDRLYVDIGVPYHFEVNDVSNYLEAHLLFRENKEDSLNTSFYFYDKVTFPSIIPSGIESDIWLALGTTHFNLDLVDVPAFGSYLDRFVNMQIGLSDRFEFKGNKSVTLAAVPKVYLDYLYGNNKSWKLGITFASDVGIDIKTADGIFGFFFGATPRLNLIWGKTIDSGSKINEFQLNTNILWSGNLGMSIFLPGGFEIDTALTLDSEGVPARITLQVIWVF